MQAKLPDVNAAIVRHRSLALEGFKSGNPELAIVSIESINALLPTTEEKNYKVEVDSEKYWKLKEETKHITCKFCKDPNLLNDVIKYELEMDWLEKILAQKETKIVWVCLKCGKANDFSTDDITVTKKGEPYFFQVMPSPPGKQNGIKGRMTFDIEFNQWFSIAMPEIESQIGIYRSEYQKQTEQEEMEIPDE